MENFFSITQNSDLNTSLNEFRQLKTGKIHHFPENAFQYLHLQIKDQSNLKNHFINPGDALLTQLKPELNLKGEFITILLHKRKIIFQHTKNKETLVLQSLGISEDWAETKEYFTLFRALSHCKSSIRSQLLELLLSAILQLFMDPPGRAQPQSKSRKHFNELGTWLANNIKSKITRKNAGEFLGLCPDYINIICKENIGMTFKDYILHIRLEESRRLLKKYSINETAEACQFSNSSHFIMAFKKHYGQTPLKFKKSPNQNTNGFAISPALTEDLESMIQKPIQLRINASNYSLINTHLFINDSSDSYELIWISPSKTRESYGFLNPGARLTMGCYPGRLWIFKGKSDSYHFMTREKRTIFIITQKGSQKSTV